MGFIPLVYSHGAYSFLTFIYFLFRIVRVGVFPPGVTPTSKFVCVLPFPDGDARRHRDLSWFGQEKAIRPAGGEKFVLYCT